MSRDQEAFALDASHAGRHPGTHVASVFAFERRVPAGTDRTRADETGSEVPLPPIRGLFYGVIGGSLIWLGIGALLTWIL